MKKEDEKNLAAPEGLSEKGRKAHEVIMDHLIRGDLTYTGGGRVFYSPAEWTAKGEEYGTSSQLVVVYDGAAARRVFNMDACYDAGSYAPMEELQAALAAEGMFFGECTGWYSAVYLKAAAGARAPAAYVPDSGGGEVAKLIDVQLETCDANPDGVAFYAYFEGEPTQEDLDRAFGACSRVPGPLGPADWEGPEDRKEAPNALSEHAGLRRWYVSAAC